MKRVFNSKHLIRACLFSLIVAGATNSFGQVSTLQNWTNLYHGTSRAQQNLNYTVPAGSNANRILVVAIASTRTTTGTRTVALTYGGQALTPAAGDMGQTLYQHTALYYLNESGLDAATNTTLAVTVSNGTTRITDVFAAVFDNVDQSGPITNSRNYYSGSVQNIFAYNPGLTVNAQDQAIEIVSSHRTGSTALRTVSSYPTNWSLTTEQTNQATDATRNMIISRSLPISDITADVASITMSGTSYPSMTALSLNSMPLTYYTLSAGNDGNGTVTLNPAGGSYLNGTTVTLTPVPNPGYGFSGWTGTDAGDVVNTGGVYTVVMNEAKSVTATFERRAMVLTDGMVSSGTGDANASSVSFSHTTGTGADRLMLAGVSWNCGTTSRTISTITFSYGAGPTILNFSPVYTQLGENSSGDDRFSAIYSLLNPPSGVTGTITVTFSGTVSNGSVAGVVNFADVNQTTPLGTPTGASLTSGTTPTVNLTGLTGNELVFDNVFQGASASSQTLTAGSGQSQNWNAYISNVRAASSIEQAAGSSVTMSWTAASASTWAIAAVPIIPKPLNYTLTAGNNGYGTVTLEPSGGSYASGTTVTLTPVPNTGYAFSSWSGTDAGDIINNGGVYTIVMNEDKSIIANFSIPASGSVTSTITPSDATPRIDDQITATVYIDMSGVNAPDNYLGSYTATLNWNASVLSYVSHTGHPPSGFVGSVNTANASSGTITFNGASVDGATGNILMLTLTFNVVGSGTSALDLAYSAMAATPTTRALLPILTVTDGQVVVAGPPTCARVVTDGAASSGIGAPATGSVSFSHTTGTGTDRLLLVGVSWNCGTTDRSISSVTFSYGPGPTVLDLGAPVITYNGYSTANPRYSAIYKYVNPPSGVTGTMTITFSGNVSNGIVAGAANFAGVNQTTPLGTPVSAGSGTTQQTTATVAVPTPNGNELVFDNLFIGYQSGQTVTVVEGQSQQWNRYDNATSFNTVGAASTEQSAGSSVTMSWTATTAAYYSLTAVPVNPSTTTTSWLGTHATNPTAWNEPTNWCFGVPTEATDVTISAYPVNQPVIPATAVCRNLTIDAGASLTINAGQALTVNGNLVSNGNLNVQSDGTSTGSLIVAGTSTGNVTFNRSLSPTGYHYFSSPVELSTLPAPVYEYSEGNDSWISTSTYVKGKGYTISGVGSLSFTGTVITNPVQIPVTSPYLYPFDGTVYAGREHVNGRDPDLVGGNYGGGGWNLLGNPYTSAINVYDFIDANFSTTPSESKFDPNYVALYLYNGESYVFVTGDDETGWGDPNDYNDGIGQLESTHLQAGQGFFVLAMNDGVEFIFTRDMQEHRPGTIMLKSARTSGRWPGLSLKVTADGSEKSTLVVFNDGMTTGLDPIYDVGQMGSGGAVNIYTALVESNGVNFSRQALPENGAVKNVIPVGLDYVKGGNVTFSAEVEPFRNFKFWLEDRETGIVTDLGSNSYSVNIPSKTGGTGRFFIHVAASRSNLRDHKNVINQMNLTIWSSQSKILHIEGDVSEKSICQIYDMQGLKVWETQLSGGCYNSFILSSLKTGVYLVTVTEGFQTYTRRVVLL